MSDLLGEVIVFDSGRGGSDLDFFMYLFKLGKYKNYKYLLCLYLLIVVICIYILSFVNDRLFFLFC